MAHYKFGQEPDPGTVWLTERSGSKDTGVLCSVAAVVLGDEGVPRELDDLQRIRDLYPVTWIDECNAVMMCGYGLQLVQPNQVVSMPPIPTCCPPPMRQAF